MGQRPTERGAFLMLSRLLLLSTVMLAGCNAPPVSIVAATGGVAPFDSLRDVQLGMTARDLARVRPVARPAAYTGYEESIAGFSVAYRIPGSYSEEQTVSPRARILSVSAGRAVDGIASGLAEWRRIVHEAGAKLELLPVCSRVDTGSGTVGLEAEWRRDGSSFTASLYESAATRGSPHAVRIGLMVARGPSRAGGPNGRARTDCNAGVAAFRHP